MKPLLKLREPISILKKMIREQSLNYLELGKGENGKILQRSLLLMVLKCNS
jgi:hypothetical protein